MVVEHILQLSHFHRTKICKLCTVLYYNHTLHSSANRDCELEGENRNLDIGCPRKCPS